MDIFDEDRTADIDNIFVYWPEFLCFIYLAIYIITPVTVNIFVTEEMQLKNKWPKLSFFNTNTGRSYWTDAMSGNKWTYHHTSIWVDD